MRKKFEKKSVIKVLIIIVLIIIGSFGIYYVIDKEVIIEISPTELLLNNTIYIEVNDEQIFKENINEMSLLKRPIQIGTTTNVNGFSINIKVYGIPLNISNEEEFNVLYGRIITIYFKDNQFHFNQISDRPDQE